MMGIVGYLLFALALFFYVTTVKAIWRLVSESKAIGVAPRNSFNRFWWMPAWKVHREAFPESYLRRQIIIRFALTWVLMIVAVACIALPMIQNMAIRK